MRPLWRWLNLGKKSKAVTKDRSAGRRARRLMLESLDSRRVLASAYQNPGQVFDVNNDTYVDGEDIRLSEVRLASLGEGKLPTTRDHHLIPFYDVNGDGSFTKQDLADLRKQVSKGFVTTSIKLSNDAGNPLDRKTNDLQIDGRVMNFDNRTRVFAWFGEGVWSRVEITQLVQRNGSFHLDIHDLHRINGRIFADGAQTMFIQAYDRVGRTSGVVDYSFTIDRQGPQSFDLGPMESALYFVGDQSERIPFWVAHWTQGDARSYDLRITTDAAGKNTVLYEHDLTDYYYNGQYSTNRLPGGTYYIWLTGFDETGNRTEATGSGQQATWAPEIFIQKDPTIDPVKMETKLVDGVPTDTWNAVLTTYDNRSFAANIVITRDRAGLDIVRDDLYLSNFQKEFSFTHLEKGVYYITIYEGYRGNGIKLIDTLEVNWNPQRPDDFSSTPPGFVIGDSLDLQWEAAAGAVRYEVRLQKSDFARAQWNGLNPDVDNLPRDLWWERYSNAYGVLVGNFDATTTHYLLENLEEGQYAVEVIAIDAEGRQTLSRNIPEFTVNSDGTIDQTHSYDHINIGRYGDTVSIYANPTLSGVAMTRIEIYTSPDCSPESLLETHDITGRSGFSTSITPYLAYPALYVKATYFDYKGVSIVQPVAQKFEPAKLQEDIIIVHDWIVHTPISTEISVV